mmetsp:Transcript_8508/g.12701  ORF Transcript_8508/g.12701 Transcript_8508/m.12701 type:complete len:713 (-) Transcript_8508:121-2259(-)
MYIYLVLVLLCVYCSADYDGDSFHGSLEHTVDSAPCVRLFTNDKDIGCRTTDDISVGALYEIRSSDDISHIKSIDVEFALVVPGQYFDGSLISLLEKHKPKGVIVYDENWVPGSDGRYSMDVNTTQGTGTAQADYTFHKNYVWNTYGNGGMYKSLSYPVVRASDNEVSYLKHMCSENRKYGMDGNRVNVAEFKYYMGKKKVTSEECLAWRDTYGHRSPQCLPLGGLSVWATKGVLDDRDKVVVTTGIDSVSFFHDLAFGANDAAASIATLLAAADAVGQYVGTANQTTLPLQPLFFAANAEEWGYAGSRRFARDIQHGLECNANVAANASSSGLPLCTDPIYPNTLFERILSDSVIQHVVAIDQVGVLNDDTLYIHSLGVNTDLFELIINSTEGVENVNIAQSSVPRRIPPTPMTSFLRENNNLNGKSVVLAGYDGQFSDPLYHTRFDSGNKTVSVDDTVRSATALARSVIAVSGGDPSLTPEVNASWVADILQCLLEDWSCPIMSKYVSYETANLGEYLGGTVHLDAGESPPSYYVGVLEASTGGLPVVQHGHYVYGRYTGEWDAKHDRVYAVPNYLEAFIRTSLSHHLGLEGNTTTECMTSADCGSCSVLEYSDVQMECVLARCQCPSAFYHLALDPGVEPETTPNYFEVVDNTSVAYTEPYWSTISTTVYPTAGRSISVVSLVVGITVSILSIAGGLFVRENMVKLKVL